MPRRDAAADSALREDIRFLGRLLGDTIREQAGVEVFELVEHIRRNAIQYRRQHDLPSLKELEKAIGSLDQPQAANVVRAFSYFHHLANLAEDLHNNRRRRGKDAPKEGSLAFALERLRAAGVTSRQIIAM